MQEGIYFWAEQKQHITSKVWVLRDGLKIHIPGREVFWKHRDISYGRAAIPNKILLKHGNTFAPDTLEINEQEFKQYLKRERVKVNYLPSKPGAAITKIMLGLAVFCLLLLAGIIAAWMLLMPKIATFAAKKIPRDTEVQLGKPMLRSFLAGEITDSAKSVLINHFYRQHNIKVDIPVNITVVQSPVLNAFAIPGGELVVYTGLLHKLEHPGQLAALLGHEAGHIQYRHSLVSLVRNLSGHVLLLLLLQDAGGMEAILAERAQWLQQLAYSRELELEADRFGLMALKQNGYDAAHMAELMRVLKEAAPENGPPDFLSTHPSPDERIRLMQEGAKTHAPQVNSQPPDSAQYYWQMLKSN